MTYTPEQLRDWIAFNEDHNDDGSRADYITQLRAHAAALEEVERLKADMDEWKKDAITVLGQRNEEHIRANNAEAALAEQKKNMQEVIDYWQGRDEMARDALAESERRCEAQSVQIAEHQAKIDRLMLEYCPDEMSNEQLAEWGHNQRAEFKEE